MVQTAIYESILKSINSGIIAAGAGGNIDYMNPRALSMLNLSHDNVIDLDIRRLIPDAYVKLSKQLDAIFKGTSDGLWVHDSDGTVININTVSEMINGIRAKDVIGKSIYNYKY